VTGDELIALALRTAGVQGVGQTALAQDSADALSLLNSILATWQAKRWLIPSLTDVYTTSTGAVSYTVGPGGDFDTPRPDRIEAAYIRALYTTGANLLDFAIDQFGAPEDYAALSLKYMGLAQNGMAATLFYDPGLTQGTVYFWPIPSSQYQLHILVKAAVGPITDTTATIALPDSYLRALIYSLASDCITAFALPPRPDIEMKAAGALSAVKASNLRIPEAQMPAALRGVWGWMGFGHRMWSGGGGGTIPDPSTLPTTLPAVPGVYWNNGGMVSIS